MKLNSSTSKPTKPPPAAKSNRRIRRLGDRALSRLTGLLLRRHLAETDNPVLRDGLKRAAVEAESLAWLSPVPLLVLPALLEEKARAARLYAYRQAAMREASRDWLTLAE